METPDQLRSLDELMAELYDVLKSIALSVVQGRLGPRVADPTEVVNEAYLKLNAMEGFDKMRRPDFLALAAKVIRNLLVDLARRDRAGKRGGNWERISLRDVRQVTDAGSLDILALDEAMSRLADCDPRQSRIVELRFFGGLTGDEVAAVLGVSRRTVTQEWTMARAWLRRELGRR